MGTLFCCKPPELDGNIISAQHEDVVVNAMDDGEDRKPSSVNFDVSAGDQNTDESAKLTHDDDEKKLAAAVLVDLGEKDIKSTNQDLSHSTLESASWSDTHLQKDANCRHLLEKVQAERGMCVRMMCVSK